MTDFTGPGVAMKRGRRQEPRTIAELSASGLLARWIRRVPAAVLLRFAIRKRKTAKSLLGPSGYHPAFLEFRPDRLSSSVPLITFCEFALTPIFSHKAQVCVISTFRGTDRFRWLHNDGGGNPG
jgi:hypothetical protein